LAIANTEHLLHQTHVARLLGALQHLFGLVVHARFDEVVQHLTRPLCYRRRETEFVGFADGTRQFLKVALFLLRIHLAQVGVA